jgi:uncharacterized C2H2 Zn-finger protein
MNQREGGKIMTAEQHKCERCGGSFGSERELQQHAQEAHGAGSFKCHACGGEFSSQQALEEHARAEHQAG